MPFLTLALVNFCGTSEQNTESEQYWFCTRQDTFCLPAVQLVCILYEGCISERVHLLGYFKGAEGWWVSSFFCCLYLQALGDFKFKFFKDFNSESWSQSWQVPHHNFQFINAFSFLPTPFCQKRVLRPPLPYYSQLQPPLTYEQMQNVGSILLRFVLNWGPLKHRLSNNNDVKTLESERIWSKVMWQYTLTASRQTIL